MGARDYLVVCLKHSKSHSVLVRWFGLKLALDTLDDQERMDAASGVLVSVVVELSATCWLGLLYLLVV
jgi:hypothetical protein